MRNVCQYYLDSLILKNELAVEILIQYNTNLVVTWEPQKAFVPPRNAVKGGVDRNGNAIYVGRASHAGDLIPGKALPTKSVAYIPYNGREIMKYSFEVMCTHTASDQNRISWNEWDSRECGLPDNAIPAGCTATGEILYVGRVIHSGVLAIGKVHHGVCYTAFDYCEHANKKYEILVYT